MKPLRHSSRFSIFPPSFAALAGWLFVVATGGTLGHQALEAQQIPTYTLIRLGMTDAASTRADGYQESTLDAVTSTGYVSGVSDRFGGVGGSVALGQSAWLADLSTGITVRVGLTDSTNTASSGTYAGYQYSEVDFLNNQGIGAGSSDRYNGANLIGSAAWVASAVTGVTMRVGFTGPIYTVSGGDDDGAQVSSITALSQDGYAAGYSERYNGTNSIGLSAWVANAATGVTRQVGFTDPQNTVSSLGSDNGYQLSSVDFLNDHGSAAGFSTRYSGSTDLGQSAWVADASTGKTVRVGYSDGNHSISGGTQSGYQYSSITQLNENGLVTGYSERFSGANDLGQSAWFDSSSDAPPVAIGFTDSEHTQSGGGASNGTQLSEVDFLNDAGIAAGNSSRFSGSNDAGQSAWLANSATGLTTRVGLIDSNYTQTGGYRSSQVNLLNETTLAAGYSRRYNGAAFQGIAAWLADSSTGLTTRVGLTDAEHTQNGLQVSLATLLNDNGEVAGFSYRYANGGNVGQSAWIASASDGVSTEIGLSGGIYTKASDGTEFSAVTALTDSDYAAGYSLRYTSSGGDGGQTAWVYDATDEAFSPIILSIRASDQYAYSTITQITEQGLAIGTYTLFSAGGGTVGSRAFAWTEETGAYDLGSVSSGGWSQLTGASFADALGWIVGYGTPLSSPGGIGVYAANPVPEPSAALLGLVAALGFLIPRRGRRMRS